MKLDIRHTFPCSPARFWEMYWDDELDAMLNEGSTVQRDVVEERTEGAVVVRRLRFTPDQELPSAAASLLGTNKLTYEQENRYDPDAGRLDWTLIPTFLPGKIKAAGAVEAHPAGDDQCEMVVSGEIKVNITFIGGQVEKRVVAEVERSWNRTAETCREWLRRHTT